MSQYRRNVVDNTLIWEKRKLLPRLTGWRWLFNRSDEDFLNRMRNRMLAIRAELAMLQRRIPQEEERVKKVKEGLSSSGGGTSSPVRDSWKPRKEPVRLLEKVNIGRKKKDRPYERKPVTLAKIVTDGRS